MRIRGLNKFEKAGATFGTVLALAAGGLAIKGGEMYHDNKAACSPKTENKQRCDESNLGNTLGTIGAVGVGFGLMLTFVACAEEAGGTRETLPFGQSEPQVIEVIEVEAA